MARYAIQRLIADRDGAHWRSMVYTDGERVVHAMRAAQQLAVLAVPAVVLRVVEEGQNGAHRVAYTWSAADGWR